MAASPADAAPAARSLNALGSDLYAALVEGNDENLVFSPASILLALAMARAGAAGTTASEMDAVLHIDDPEAIHHALNGLTRALEARSGTIEVNGEPAELELSIANAVWGQATLTWQDAFLDLLAREYGAGVRLADFVADPEAARVAVNDWVAEETRDRIPELIAAGMVDELTRMILVNAIYLKAPWAIPFEPDATWRRRSRCSTDRPSRCRSWREATTSMAYARARAGRRSSFPTRATSSRCWCSSRTRVRSSRSRASSPEA